MDPQTRRSPGGGPGLRELSACGRRIDLTASIPIEVAVDVRDRIDAAAGMVARRALGRYRDVDADLVAFLDLAVLTALEPALRRLEQVVA